jgi:hypothetical protein
MVFKAFFQPNYCLYFYIFEAKNYFIKIPVKSKIHEYKKQLKNHE